MAVVRGPFCSFEPASIKIEVFLDKLEGLSPESRVEIRREIIRVILQIQTGAGALGLRRLMLNQSHLEEFLYFKQYYLDISHYLHQVLWKAAINAVNGFPVSYGYRVNQDAKWCLSHLLPADLDVLKQRQINDDLDVSHIDFSKWKIGKNKKQKIQSYINGKAYPLRFLSKYDSAIDSEDNKQDLFVEMFRVVNSYSRAKGKLPVNEVYVGQCVTDACNEPATVGKRCALHDRDNRIQQYVEVALNNKVNNIKEHHTTGRRRRLATTNAEVYQERNKLKKQLVKARRDGEDTTQIAEQLSAVEKQLKNNPGDFYTTVFNLSQGTEPGKPDLEQVIGSIAHRDGSYGTKAQIESALWVDAVCKKVKPSVARFVKIVVGAVDNDFESWAASNDVSLESFTSLVSNAKKYLKIDLEELKSNKALINMLQEVRNG